MKAMILWFTGLSGAGKSTVASGVEEWAKAQGIRIMILDGDYIRTHWHTQLGFTPEDIKKNNKLIAEWCKQHRHEYEVILVPIISPYRESREAARLLLSPHFYEIYFAAPLSTVMARDVKGLYAKAKDGQLKGMIGYDPEAVYEAPLQPDLTLNSSKEPVLDSVKRLIDFIVKQR